MSPRPPARRGACPAFLAPMETGDGLILRLVPAEREAALLAMSPTRVRPACLGEGEWTWGRAQKAVAL